jgi:uncharacterized protein YbjT (DUF2867 family)
VSWLARPRQHRSPGRAHGGRETPGEAFVDGRELRARRRCMAHEKGEAAIRSASILFTFVQPSGFMSNLLAWTISIRNEGVVRSSTGDGRRAFIHSEDIAAVSVAALSFGEVTAEIGAVIGRDIEYLTISDDEARKQYSTISGSPEETEAHVALWRAIRENRVSMLTDRVEQILGRKPMGLGQWLTENSSAFSI